MSFTIGSLFDGSGGFPLAASLCGINPIWASEVEPYPIAVTRSRFPNMVHLGDISKINGAEIPPVDVITFGSPCQDLSIAGKRAGLKHEDNGDEETTRSGLFMEAVRIIKEMRRATDGKYPTFALWENVPGAFSSNRGEDFRVVCEELIKIVEPSAVMPGVPKNGWAYADYYCGDGWSLAYRVFDAQYWGVPQRRRRIHLVLDLRGEHAREILFEREGLRGYFAQSGAQREAVARNVDDCSATANGEGECIAYSVQDRAGCPGGGKGMLVQENRASSLRTANYQYIFQPVKSEPIAVATQQGGAEVSENGVCPTITAAAGMSGNNQPWICVKTWDARGNGEGDVVNTITGDHENRVTDYTSVIVEPASTYWDGGQIAGTLTANNAGGSQRMPDKENFNCVIEQIVSEPIIIDRAFYNSGENAQYSPQVYTDGTVPTIVAKGPSAVCVQYVVRRLTPTECARLQGFADRWGDIDDKDDFTDEEYQFWLDVRNTHAEINGKAVKEYTKAQMLTWYNKLHTDSAEYKMWGNGIALPPALYCMQGIAEVLYAGS